MNVINKPRVAAFARTSKYKATPDTPQLTYLRVMTPPSDDRHCVAIRWRSPISVAHSVVRRRKKIFPSAKANWDRSFREDLHRIWFVRPQSRLSSWFHRIGITCKKIATRKWFYISNGTDKRQVNIRIQNRNFIHHMTGLSYLRSKTLVMWTRWKAVDFRAYLLLRSIVLLHNCRLHGYG